MVAVKTPKDFEDFLANAWPHLVAEVKMNTWLLRVVLAAIIGGAVAIIVAGG